MTRFNVRGPGEGDVSAGYWSIEGYNDRDELVLDLDAAPEVFREIDLISLFELTKRASRQPDLSNYHFDWQASEVYFGDLE